MDFRMLSKYMEKLEKTSSQTEMIRVIADVFKKSNQEEIDTVCYFLVGQVYPAYKDVTVGMGEKMVISSIALAADKDEKRVKKKMQELGDPGDVAAQIVRTRKNRFSDYFEPEGEELSVEDVKKGLRKIATAEGSGSQEIKKKTLSAILIEADKRGRKYIGRLTTGTMRLGVGDMTVLDGLAKAFLGSKEKRPPLEHAYNVCSDIGRVAEVLKKSGLDGVKRIRIAINRPLRPMLAQRTSKLSEIREKIESDKISAEEKYDGQRIQAHKDGDKVTLFSRRLTDITHQFPDLVKNVRKHVKAEKAVLDGEAVAYNFKKDEFYPFQKLMQRRRKYDVEEYAEDIPVKYMVFDIIYLNGKSMLRKSYPERRGIVEKVVKNRKYIGVTGRVVADNLKDIDEFFQDAIKRGLEGVICKSCAEDSYYKAGAREWSWIKWKRGYASKLSDTFDLTVVGGISGRGKRTGTYGSLVCASYNKEKDVFQTLCKLGTGFSEKQLEELPKKFEEFEVDEKHARVEAKSDLEVDQWFTPSIVVEVKGAELTKSPIHTCAQEKFGKGLSLRFPRLERWRREKEPEQSTTTKEVIEMYERQ